MTRFCCCCCFVSKRLDGHVIYGPNERGARNAKFHLSYDLPLPRLADFWRHSPSPSVCADGSSSARARGAPLSLSLSSLLLFFLSLLLLLQQRFLSADFPGNPVWCFRIGRPSSALERCYVRWSKLSLHNMINFLSQLFFTKTLTQLVFLLPCMVLFSKLPLFFSEVR